MVDDNKLLSKKRVDWRNAIFLTVSPVIAIPGTILYSIFVGFSWWMPVMFVVLYCLVGLAVTAGYHRCYSHRAYECSTLPQLFFAIFGAMSLQNTILWWSSGHRKHHSHTDDDFDPYNIKRGFWWAHILWIFDMNPEKYKLNNVKDLEKNKIVQWQHKYYVPILLVFSFGMPALIGWMCGDLVGGLLWGGFLRIVCVHHTTFFINSLAHMIGTRKYNNETSARDNALVALLSFGEGYHNYHHTFPSDYRNGIRWYHWDPAKWFIWSMKKVGMAWDLRKTSQARILKARERVKEARAAASAAAS